MQPMCALASVQVASWLPQAAEQRRQKEPRQLPSETAAPDS